MKTIYLHYMLYLFYGMILALLGFGVFTWQFWILATYAIGIGSVGIIVGESNCEEKDDFR